VASDSHVGQAALLERGQDSAREVWLKTGWRAARALAARPESVVTLFTAFHLGVSFLNQVVLAYLFGVSAEMDAFLAAGALPLAVLGLVIGELGFVLVPLLTRERRDAGGAGEAASRLFTLLVVAGLGVALLGVAGHGWILRLTTRAAIPAATLELAIALAPWIWLLVGLNFVCSFFTGLYHFHRRFALPAVVLSLPYLGMIVGGLGWSPGFGIRSVVCGWTAGTLLKTLVLAAGIWKESALRFRWDLRHPIARELGFSLVPMGVALLPFTVLPVLDVFWASGLPHGSVSALGYASRIGIALTTLLVQGIAVVLFPAIADDGAAGETGELCRKVAQAVRSILLVVVPVAALTAALRVPLLAVLFERGSFDRADTLAVAGLLPWYLAGMLGMAPMNVVSRGFFALRDYRTPAWLGLGSLGAYAALCALLVPRFSYAGIAMAYAAVWPATFFVQARFLGRAVGGLLDGETLRLLLQVGVSSLAGGLLAAQLFAIWPARLGAVPGLFLSGLAGLGAFAGLAYFVFKVPHLRMLVAGVARK